MHNAVFGLSKALGGDALDSGKKDGRRNSLPASEEKSWIEALGFCLIFILMPFLTLTPLGSSSIVGLVAVIFIGVFLIYRNRSILEFRISAVPAAFLVYFAWMLLLLLLDFSIEAMVRVVQYISCMAVFLFAALACKKMQSIRLLQDLIAVMLAFILVLWIFAGMPFRDFSCLWGNPNVFSLILFCWFAVLLLDYRRKSTPFLVIASLMIYVSSARTTALALLILFLLWLYLRKQTVSFRLRRRILILFALACILIALFMFFYIATFETDFGAYLDDLSRQYLHKGFYSGRQRIWGGVFQAANQAPLFGNGLAALPADFIDTGLSSHNLYLQTLLQSGYIGLLLLIGLFLAILSRLLKQPISGNSALAVSMLFAVMFQETFEVCLLQNHLMIGLMMWTIMGMGLKENSNPKTL